MKKLLLVATLLLSTTYSDALTGTLDDFTRADSAVTLGTNWIVFTSASGDEGITSNQGYNPAVASTNYKGMMWVPQKYGPDVEAYMTLSTVPTINNGNDGPAIDVRITSPGTGYNSYSFGLLKESGQLKAQIAKAVSGTETSLIKANTTVSNGDKIRITAIGDLLTGYVLHSNVWVLTCQTRDVTYSGVRGNVGMYFTGDNVDGRYDDFSGGNISQGAFKELLQ